MFRGVNFNKYLRYKRNKRMSISEIERRKLQTRIFVERISVVEGAESWSYCGIPSANEWMVFGSGLKRQG